MKKLILILALMFCMIFSFNALAFEKVDVTMVNCGTAVEYSLKIQTLIDHGLGTSTTAVALLDDEPAFTVYATCDQTSGTVQSAVISLVVGGAGTIVEGLHVVVSTEYMSGSWVNAIVAKLAFGTTGSAAGGIAAPVCSELNLPAQALPGGSYFNVHSYLNIPTNCSLIDSSSFNVTFERFELVGGAKGEFDDYGDFWYITGLIPEIDHVLSAHYLTLRTLVQPTSTAYDKFLVLSHEQDMLSIGTSGNAVTITAAGLDKLAVYTTSELTAGTIVSAIIQQTMTVGGTGLYAEALRVQLIGDVCMGASHNAIFAQINYLEDGFAQGEGAVIVAEIDFPSVTSPLRGEHAWFKAEINVPTACDLSATRVAIIGGQVWGGGATEFDDNGLLLNIDGVVSTASGFYYLADLTVTKADGLLKVRIANVDYYMFITTAINGGD